MRHLKIFILLTVVLLMASSAFALEIDYGRDRERPKGLDILVRNASAATLTSGDIVVWAVSPDNYSVTIPSHDVLGAASGNTNISGDRLFAGVVLETISSDDSQGTAIDRADRQNWGLIRVQGIVWANWNYQCATETAGAPVMVNGGHAGRNGTGNTPLEPTATLTSVSNDLYSAATEGPNAQSSMDVLGNWRRVGTLLEATTINSTTKAKVLLW